MEYTIRGLSKLAHVSTRTLRYYDEIGLLVPGRTSSSGYRIYSQREVDKLQQILFYRELGVPLENIRALLLSDAFDARAALLEHHAKLLRRQEQLNCLIATVEKTIDAMEGRIKMSDKEKFEGFKQTMIDQNESRYGKEVRGKYGNDFVNASNQKIRDMTQAQFDEVTALAQEILTKLAQAYLQGDPKSPLAQEVADLHRRWLSHYWPSYSKQSHAGVAQMYVDDERFSAYYDKTQPGTAVFLRDAILVYTGMAE